MTTLHRVLQHYNWDCGLACLQAILQLGDGSQSDYNRLLTSRDSISVWTPDLSYMLVQRGVRHELYTTCAGVNPSHSELVFYTGFDADAERLPAVWEALSRESALGGQQRVRVHVQPVPLQHIISALQDGTALYVVLLDMRFMHCIQCGWRPGSSSGQYAGHYVILTGIGRRPSGAGEGRAARTGTEAVRDDDREDEMSQQEAASNPCDGHYIEYLDPDCRASCSHTCCMSSDTFEAARHSEGTDDDVLEIPVPIQWIKDDPTTARGGIMVPPLG